MFWTLTEADASNRYFTHVESDNNTYSVENVHNTVLLNIYSNKTVIVTLLVSMYIYFLQFERSVFLQGFIYFHILIFV